MKSPAQVAKAALHRLAQSQQEPTPENYARAYAQESGQPASNPAVHAAGNEPVPAGPAWATLIERLARHLERGGRQWTQARRKDSLQRVLSSSRSDAGRLMQRLQGLMTAWESDSPSDPTDTDTDASVDCPPTDPTLQPAAEPADPSVRGQTTGWPPLVEALQSSLHAALPGGEVRAQALADELARLAHAVALDGALPTHVQAVQVVCERARRLFAHRHHLVDQLSALCRELTQGMTELAEDDSWARGQYESVQARLTDIAQHAGPSARGLRAATELLAGTRVRQQQVRGERQAARDAIKTLFQRMITEAGELGGQAGRFQQAVGQHAEAIEHADSLESLAGVVRHMLDDSRAVQSAVQATHQRLRDDQARAQALESRVRDLEAELRRLADEAATDALTQVANRRGLVQAFEVLVAHAAADGPMLSVALLDIDNFKKLNDSLGHAAGDVALKSLATAVRERLRPEDHLARFGGEEFVVLLPDTALADAQQALSRLQRALSAGLFMHEGKDVLVTFSAGVTAWQAGETLEAALERADEALYEAKRTGKNRTCTA